MGCRRQRRIRVKSSPFGGSEEGKEDGLIGRGRGRGRAVSMTGKKGGGCVNREGHSD